MGGTKSYKTSAGVFDIPEAEVKDFLSDNPDATEVSSFVMDKDTFDIPLSEVDAFKADNPNAQPLGLKKKVGGEQQQSESDNGLSNGEEDNGIPFISPQFLQRTPTTTQFSQDDLRSKIKFTATGVGEPAGGQELAVEMKSKKDRDQYNKAYSYLSTANQQKQLLYQGEQERQKVLTDFKKTFPDVPEHVAQEALNTLDREHIKAATAKYAQDLKQQKVAQFSQQFGQSDFQVPGQELNPEMRADQQIKNELYQYGIDAMNPDQKKRFQAVQRLNQLKSQTKTEADAMKMLTAGERKYIEEYKDQMLYDQWGNQIDADALPKQEKENQQEISDLMTAYSKNYRDKAKELYEEKAMALKYVDDLMNQEVSQGALLPKTDYRTLAQGSTPSFMQSAAKKEAMRLSEIRQKVWNEFEAAKRLYLLNQDPAKSGDATFSRFTDAMQEGFKNSLFAPIVNDLYNPESLSQGKFQDAYQQFASEGLPISEKQKEEFQQEFIDKFAATTGYSLPTMLEIMGSTVVMNQIGAVTGVTKLAQGFEAAATAKYGKGGKLLANMMTNTAKGYVTYAPTQETGWTGAGEGLPQTFIDMLNPEKWAGGKYRKFFELAARVAVGTTGETIQEYSGQFVNALAENGYNWEEVFNQTFGRTPEDREDQLLLTVLQSAMFSTAFNIGVLKDGLVALKSSSKPEAKDMIPMVEKVIAEREEQMKEQEQIAKGTPPEETDLAKKLKQTDEQSKQAGALQIEGAPTKQDEGGAINAPSEPADDDIGLFIDELSESLKVPETQPNLNNQEPNLTNEGANLNKPQADEAAIQPGQAEKKNEEIGAAGKEEVPDKPSEVAEPVEVAAEVTKPVVDVEKPTFKNVPILTRTAEEVETAKNEVFNNLSKLEVGSVIENSDGEIKVVTEKSTDKKGNQLIGVVTYERQADGSLRQMTNVVWASKGADGKIKLEYNPHSTGTNSKGERVTVTDEITDKKIDLSKEDIFTEDENGNLVQINKSNEKAQTPETKVLTETPAAQEVVAEEKVTKSDKTKTSKKETLSPDVVQSKLKDLATDEMRFQNREGLDEERVQHLVDNFDPNKLDPIVVWDDPASKKRIVLSGHHRFEAAKRRGMKDIPTRIFKGTEQEAMDFAKDSNTLGKQETPVERAKRYRGLRQQGKSISEIQNMARQAHGADANFIVNLSMLDENSKALQTIAQFDKSSDTETKSKVRSIGDWIGQIVRKHDDLSVQQQNEMYDFLFDSYSKKAGAGKITNKNQWTELADHLITKLKNRKQFTSDTVINFKNSLGKSGIELEYDEATRQAEQNVIAAQKALNDKRAELLSRSASKEDMDRILEKYENEVRNALSDRDELRKQKDNVKKAAQAQTSIFDLIEQANPSENENTERELQEILDEETPTVEEDEGAGQEEVSDIAARELEKDPAMSPKTLAEKLGLPIEQVKPEWEKAFDERMKDDRWVKRYQSTKQPAKESKTTARKVRDEKLRKEIDDLWDELGKDIKPTMGVDPNQLATGIKIISKYTQAGIYKLSDILEDASVKLGERFADLFDAIKAAYSAYYAQAPDDIADKMDDPRSVRKVKVEDFGKKESKPIRQLGTGSNVYFETDKYRVNDLKGGKVVLNVGENSDMLVPVLNAEFDNVEDAVRVAKELQRVFPEGVPKALDVKKYIEQLKSQTDEKAQPESTGTRPEPAGTAATGRTSTEQRPAIRVVDEGDIPQPGNHVNVGQYDIDEHQRLGVNLAIQAFSDGKKGFLLGDGTGVGKTRQLLITAAEWKKRSKKPVLIITQNKQIIDGSFTSDAKALGIKLSDFDIHTYTDASNNKIPNKEYGLVIYDESQNMKNADSLKSIAAQGIKTDNKMFATATPMDRPMSAAYFLSEITGKSMREISEKLGFTTANIENPVTKKMEMKVYPSKGQTWAQVFQHIIDLRNEAIKNGQMIRREYPFFGTISSDKISLGKDFHTEQVAISDYWDELAEDASFNGKKNILGQRIGELSRHTEASKIDTVYAIAKKAIAEGKSVIVVAEGVNPTLIKALNQTYPGMLGALKEKFTKDGIKVASIFGTGDKSAEIARFNNGDAQVALATPQSGGTGVNLDDTIGDKPRLMLLATTNYSGDQMDQMFGRVSRRNTKSPADLRLITSPESLSDSRRLNIFEQKATTLRRVQAGEDPDMVELEQSGADAEAEARQSNQSEPYIQVNEGKVYVHNSYPIKDRLKAIGARWHKFRKAWVLEHSMLESAQKIVDEYKDTKKTTTEKLLDALEGMKIDIKGGQTFALPFPPQLWNGFVYAVKGALKAGIKINEAIKKGIDYLKSQGVSDTEASDYEQAYRDSLFSSVNSGKIDKRRFMERFMNDEEVLDEIKDSIHNDAKEYAIKSNILTNNEANEIIKTLGIDAAHRFVLDFKNDLTFRVRVGLAQNILRRLNKSLEKETDAAKKREIHGMAVELAEGLAKYGTELGQGVQAFAMWSKLSPEGLLMYYRQQKKRAKTASDTTEETDVEGEADKDIEFEKEILELTKKRDEAPEGFLQDEITVQILNKIANKTQTTAGKYYDIVWSLWYASVLSGWQTQAVNLGGNIINGSAETFISGIQEAFIYKDPKAIPGMLKALWDGLAEGSNQFNYILRKGTQLGKKSDRVEASDALERTTFKGGAFNPYNYYKFVPRLMSAVDNMAYYGLYHMRYYEMARKVAREEGLKGKALADKVNRIMVDDTTEFERAKMQAEAELAHLASVTGEEYKEYIVKKRAYEILDQKRRNKYPDQVTEADRFASFGTFNYRPQGFLGAMSNAAANLGRKVPPFRLIVPFTRIVANVLNQQIDYTPYGFLRASGYSASSIYGKIKPENDILKTSPENVDQMHRAVFKAAFGTTLMMGLYAMSNVGDEDDEDYFDINGRGPSDKAKRDQLYAQGWKPYSIRVGNKYINYQYTPLAIAFVLIGNYRDYEKYRELGEKDMLTRWSFAAGQVGPAIFEMSFLASLSKFMEGMGRPGNPDSFIQEQLGSTASSVKPLVPVVGTNFVKQLSEIFDPTIYSAETAKESLYKGIPFAQSELKPVLNALGQPSEKAGNRFVSFGNDDPVWKMLGQKNVFIPAIGRTTKLNGEPMTHEQYYEYAEHSGQMLYNELRENLGKYEAMDNAAVDKAIDDKAKEFRRIVKSDMEKREIVQQLKTSATPMQDLQQRLKDKKITRAEYYEIKKLLLKK